MNSKQPTKPVAKSKQGPRRFIKAEDLQDLYLLVKGSRFANDLIEAETVFAQGNLRVLEGLRILMRTDQV